MKKIIALFMIAVSLLSVSGCRAIPKMPGGMPKSPANDAVESSSLITEDEAKEIVLDKAGLKPEEVAFDRVELDFDDGVWIYEFEFIHEKTEFEIELRADNGDIIKWEKDSIY